MATSNGGGGSGVPASAAGPSAGYMPMRSSAAYMGGYGGYSSFGGGMMQQPQMFMQQQPVQPVEVEGKGKSRFVELDDNAWEAEFAKQEAPVAATQKQDDGELTQAQEDALEQASAEADDAVLQNLENTWKQLQSSIADSAVQDKELAQWEATFGSQFADANADMIYGDGEGGSGAMALDPAKFQEYLDNLDAFQFVEENNYDEMMDPFAEGQRLLAAGAPLSEAALAFEAACRKDENRAEAWRALGDTLAADEKEIRAIKALEKACSLASLGTESSWVVSGRPA